MNDLERCLRELPRPAPSKKLDGRIALLLSTAQADAPPPQRNRPAQRTILATAIAAGLAGFALGIGFGQWTTAPPSESQIAQSETRQRAEPPETEPTLVHLTDTRISSGLDFSQSLEPFRVEPVDQEGS